MAAHVIRDPKSGLYAQAWYRCPPGEVETFLRIDWVSKAQASSYQKRKEATDVLSRFPDAQWEVR